MKQESKMGFWEFADRNGFGLAVSLLIASAVGSVVGLVAYGMKISSEQPPGPPMCSIPCSGIKNGGE